MLRLLSGVSSLFLFLPSRSIRFHPPPPTPAQKADNNNNNKIISNCVSFGIVVSRTFKPGDNFFSNSHVTLKIGQLHRNLCRHVKTMRGRGYRPAWFLVNRMSPLPPNRCTHTRTHARTHARTYAHMHARAHTRTHTRAEREGERENKQKRREKGPADISALSRQETPL